MKKTKTNSSTAIDQGQASAFYRAAWRWHFYASLYVIPFLIMLAITGLAMMWIAYFDGRDGEMLSVEPQGKAQVISQQAETATAAFPNGQLAEYIGPKSAAGVGVFRISDGESQRMIAINPYSGELLSHWVRRDGWYDFFSDIHGTLLIGDTGDRLIEIAAGLSFILITSGLYLFWPRKSKGLHTMLVPDLSARGRSAWRSWHSVIGIYISALLIVFLLTGLAWTGVWGAKFVQAWSSFPAEKWDNVPLSDATHASMNHGATKDVPWGLEQTAMPASTNTVDKITTAPTLDDIVAKATELGFQGRYRVNFPQGDTGVWTISQDAMSNDSSDPSNDRFVHIDQYTGTQLVDIGYADYSLGAKAMATGLALHEGDMGVWNLILNTVFCLAVVFLCSSGVVMWLLRRPTRDSLLAAPPVPTDMPHWRGAMLLGLFFCIAFPLVGLTLLAIFALDYLFVSRVPVLRRALS